MDAGTLRALCGSWLGVAEDVKWGDDLVFTVGGRMFCVLGLGVADAGRLSFKVDPERFLEYTDRKGILPAPYMARAHWVSVESDPAGGRAMATTELAQAIRHSYDLVFARLPKRQQRQIAGDG